MINRQDIENLIDEILEDELTLASCNDLASLYILLEHFPSKCTPNDDLTSLLVDYMGCRDLVHLNVMLTKISDAMSEVYHTIDTDAERQEFRDFVNRINSILAPTVV